MEQNDIPGSIDAYLSRAVKTIESLDREAIATYVTTIESARLKGNMVYTCGNGGSASTASHVVCDLNKGVSYTREQKFRVICLNDSISTMMAYANDVSYDDVFVEPLANFCRPGDVLIGFSGSGNSENVLRAFRYARSNGATTVGFCGYDGGALKGLSDIAIHVDVDDMLISEDLHLMIHHLTARILGVGC